jgi:hypothetical protein
MLITDFGLISDLTFQGGPRSALGALNGTQHDHFRLTLWKGQTVVAVGGFVSVRSEDARFRTGAPSRTVRSTALPSPGAAPAQRDRYCKGITTSSGCRANRHRRDPSLLPVGSVVEIDR